MPTLSMPPLENKMSNMAIADKNDVKPATTRVATHANGFILFTALNKEAVIFALTIMFANLLVYNPTLSAPKLLPSATYKLAAKMPPIVVSTFILLPVENGKNPSCLQYLS